MDEFSLPAVVGVALFIVGGFVGGTLVEWSHPDPLHLVCDESSELYNRFNITEVYGVTYPALGDPPEMVGTDAAGSIVRYENGTLEQIHGRIYSAGGCERVAFYGRGDA